MKTGKTFRLSFKSFADSIEEQDIKHVASMVAEIEADICKSIVDNLETRKYYGNGRCQNLNCLNSAFLLSSLEG